MHKSPRSNHRVGPSKPEMMDDPSGPRIPEPGEGITAEMILRRVLSDVRRHERILKQISRINPRVACDIEDRFAELKAQESAAIATRNTTKLNEIREQRSVLKKQATKEGIPWIPRD